MYFIYYIQHIYIYVSRNQLSWNNSQRAQIRSVEPQVTLKREKNDMLNFHFQLRWRDETYPLVLSNQPINKKPTKQQQQNNLQAKRAWNNGCQKTGHQTREMEKRNKVRRVIVPAYCSEKFLNHAG